LVTKQVMSKRLVW
ncbi:mur ligase family, catalytic domain protein, partial [Vibrio parahaemolyticus V-223/04]